MRAGLSAGSTRNRRSLPTRTSSTRSSEGIPARFFSFTTSASHRMPPAGGSGVTSVGSSSWRTRRRPGSPRRPTGRSGRSATSRRLLPVQDVRAARRCRARRTGPPDEGPLRARLGSGCSSGGILPGFARGSLSRRTGRAEPLFGFDDPRRGVRAGRSGLAPARTTVGVLRQVAGEDASVRRRANYEQLRDRLDELVPPPFQELPSGASPVRVPGGDCGQARGSPLPRRRWDPCVRLLVGPSSVATDGRVSAGAGALRREVIGLPVHQELRPRDRSHRRSSPCRRARACGAGDG